MDRAGTAEVDIDPLPTTAALLPGDMADRTREEGTQTCIVHARTQDHRRHALYELGPDPSHLDPGRLHPAGDMADGGRAHLGATGEDAARVTAAIAVAATAAEAGVGREEVEGGDEENGEFSGMVKENIAPRLVHELHLQGFIH